MNELTIAELAYIAGIVDGEGSIAISRYTYCGHYEYRLRVNITLTYSDIPQEMVELFGGTISLRKPKKETHKLAYAWVISCNAAVDFLKQIQPYLRIKAEQCRLGIEFQEVCHHRTNYYKTKTDIALEEEYWNKVTALNKKGHTLLWTPV